MAFRVRPTALEGELGELAPLQFVAHLQDERGAVVRRIDPVREGVVGLQVDCGPLFAYLFRRFGAPNAKPQMGRLARYVLATPVRDMSLVVEPTMTGRCADVFAFVAPASVGSAAKEHGRKMSERLSAARTSGWVRPIALGQWDAGDPLKRYAIGAAQTLRVLARPVCLEHDGAIDMFGPVPRTRRAVRAAS